MDCIDSTLAENGGKMGGATPKETFAELYHAEDAHSAVKPIAIP